MTFINLEPKSSEIQPFDVANYKSVVDAFAAGETVNGVKHSYFIDTKIVEGIYSDIKELQATVLRLMRGQSVDTIEEVTNDDGSITKNIVYNDVPTSITGLKDKVVELVVRDFEVKVNGIYNTMTPEDFSTAVKYVVDMVVKYSDGSGSNTFATFATYF